MTKEFRMSSVDEVKDLVSHSVSSFSMHGLPHVCTSASRVRRILWFLVVITSAGIMASQVWFSLKKYFSFPTETQLALYQKHHLPLPAVTICNSNSVKYSAANNEIKNFFQQMEDSYSYPFGAPKNSTNSSYVGVDIGQFRSKLLELLPHNSLEENIAMGYQIEDMLFSCKVFKYPDCSSRNFSRIYDPTFGNCFTLNTFPDDTDGDNLDWEGLYQIRRPGLLHGIELMFLISEDEKTVATEGRGVCLVVHNQTSMPFPLSRAICVPTGEMASIGLLRREIFLDEPPYNPCADYKGDENVKRNMYISQRSYLAYTREACVKTCYQKNVIKRCNCTDTNLPSNFSAMHPGIKVEPVGACFTNEQRDCADDVDERIDNNELNCHGDCPNPCTSINHEIFPLFVGSPSELKEKEIISRLMQKSDEFYKKLSAMTQDQHTSYIRNNVVCLKIYFEDNEVIMTKKAASYTVTDLQGDVGGLMGFFLGLSIITLIEFLELFLDILLLCSKQKSASSSSIDKHHVTAPPPNRNCISPSDSI